MTDTTTTVGAGPSGTDQRRPQKPNRQRERLRRGTSIGRYIVVDLLGQGGMGSVYSAWDTELRRRVALKLLHGGRTDATRDRMLGEARALAKLRHPHVVTVYDAGFADGHLFVAMDHIEGTTLREWARVPARTRNDRIDVLLQCSEGLAAAHQAGVVHDDFKPSNVVVEQTDRGPVAQIIDFGLAALSEDSDTGLRGGTPAYMAPERTGGTGGTALSDQWSFATTAAELLRPGDTARQAGDTQGLGSLGPVLARALEQDPSRRWPSQRALSDAIRRTRVVRRRRGWLALCGLAVLATGAAGQYALDHRDCEAEAAEVLENRAPRADRDADLDTLSGHDSDLAETVRASADGWRTRWSAAYLAQCDAGLREGGPVLDCLNGQASDGASLLDVMADPQTTPSARWQLFAGIVRAARPEQCAEHTRPVPPTPASLSRAAALEVAGRFDDAIEAATEAQADAVGRDPGARARVLYRMASIERRRDASAEALALGEQAIDLAAAAQDHELVTMGVLLRSETHIDAGDYPSALEAAILARAPLHSAGDPPYRLAYWEFQLGRGYESIADYAAAEAHHREALRIREQLDPGGIYVGDSSLGVARQLALLGRCDEALPLNRRALSIYEDALGPRHPTLAHALAESAQCLATTGQVDEAESAARRAVETIEASLGPRSISLGKLLTMHGGLLTSLGRYNEAAPIFARCVALRVDVLGPRHPETAVAQVNLGWLLVSIGRATEALPHLRAALTTYEKLHGTNSYHHQHVLGGLAAAFAELDDLKAAIPLAERSLTAAEQSPIAAQNPVSVVIPVLNLAELQLRAGLLDARASFQRAYDLIDGSAEGRRHRAWPSVNLGLGELALRSGDAASARGFYQEVVDRHDDASAQPGVLAVAKFGLAQVDAAEGAARDEVRPAVEAARDALRDVPSMKRTLEQAERWLAAAG